MNLIKIKKDLMVKNKYIGSLSNKTGRFVIHRRRVYAGLPIYLKAKMVTLKKCRFYSKNLLYYSSFLNLCRLNKKLLGSRRVSLKIYPKVGGIFSVKKLKAKRPLSLNKTIKRLRKIGAWVLAEKLHKFLSIKTIKRIKRKKRIKRVKKGKKGKKGKNLISFSKKQFKRNNKALSSSHKLSRSKTEVSLIGGNTLFYKKKKKSLGIKVFNRKRFNKKGLKKKHI